MVADSTPLPNGDPTRVALRVENIDAVVQLEGSFALDAERMPETGSAMLPIHDGGRAEVEQQGDRIAVSLEYAFGAAVAPSDEEDETSSLEVEPFFVCRARFVVAYDLDSDEVAGEADLHAFAEINGRLNTVPYWREYLHNSLARAGLPAYEVTPFNPVKIAQDIERAAGRDGD